MARRGRRTRGNPLGGVALLVVGGVAALASLFGAGPDKPRAPDVAQVAQPAAPSPPPVASADRPSTPAPGPSWRNVWIRGHKVDASIYAIAGAVLMGLGADFGPGAECVFR